jgi:hypothetical protein
MEENRHGPGTTQAEQAERRTEKSHKVRQVTNVQASWTERQRGQPGKFTIQLILDHGVEEYILQPHAEDAELLLQLFSQGIPTMFDVERKVVMFGNIPVK